MTDLQAARALLDGFGSAVLESGPDRRELARLVRKYGREAISSAASKVFLRGAGRPSRGFEPTPLTRLSLSDTKALARLVGKYSRDAVSTSAKLVAPRGPGRPSRGPYPRYEQMHLADWIKEAAEEHAARGSRYPENDAMLELHELMFDRDASVSPAWLKTTKNKRLLGEKAYRELARHIQEQPKAARALGLSLASLPRWLKERK